MVDRDVRHVSVAGGGLERVGMNSAEMEGELLRDCVAEPAYDLLFPLFSAALRGECPRTEFWTHDGEASFEFAFAPVRRVDGMIVGAAAIGRDITDEVRTEEARLLSERDYRLLAENSSDMITRHAADLTYTYVSPASQAVLGYAPGELLGHDPLELVHRDDLSALALVGKEQRHSTDTSTTEVRLRRKSGAWVWVEVAARAERHEQTGEVIGFQAATRDITRRRSAEALHRETAELFETAFHDAPIGMGLTTPEGLWLKVNRALCDITGYSEADLLERSFQDITHPDDLAADAENVEEFVMGRRRSMRVDKRYIRKDGSIVAVQLDTSLVCDSDGKPRYFIAEIQDVTRQREDASTLAAAKAALQGQVEQLEELDGMKEEFISLVTHELRTPLTSVTGYLDAVLDDELSADESRHFLSVARRNAQRLVDLVEDLLLIRRIESDREEVVFESVDIAELSRLAAESLQPVAAENDVSLSADVPDVATVAGDRRRLGQIVDNLLSNAIKYTPAGGAATISVAGDHKNVWIEVADTGIGIPAAEHGHLFEPFFRASNVTSSAMPGSGLGLVVTLRLVEAHHGTIDVDSAEGRGSKFTVRLPASRE